MSTARLAALFLAAPALFRRFEPLPPGWSIRDATPYARTSHAAIVDEGSDTMIVYGGGASDTWALPLSGADAHCWRKVIPGGEYPPPAGRTLAPAGAIYDPFGKRMIVLLNLNSGNGELALWELSLSGEPTWRRLAPAGPSPGRELHDGRMVLDRDGKRALIVGGDGFSAGAWALSLEGELTWSRAAGPPFEGAGFLGPAVLDAKRGQLVVVGALGRNAQLWSLSLATGTWSLLDPGEPRVSASYGIAAVVDAANDRLVLFGGDEHGGIATFSLATHAWTMLNANVFLGGGASAILDEQRGRAVYFSGKANDTVVNTTWALALGNLQLTELVPGTRREDYGMDALSTVWDPTREAVVAFGDFSVPRTFSHGLAPADGWDVLPAGTPPAVSNMPAVYDPIGQAIIAFGGYQIRESKAVVRLSSEALATWQTLNVSDGPGERTEHVAVYDAANKRLVVHGGAVRTSYPPATILDDTWALSLEGSPAWTRLDATGASPGKRHRHVGIYDPAGQRMIVYGGSGDSDGQQADLRALALAGAPVWTELATTGTAPGDLVPAAAVYDATAQRMILTAASRSSDVRVFALDLGESPAWHRFCSPGLVPAGIGGTNAVLVPEGLFVSANGAAFLFNLDTPYCD